MLRWPGKGTYGMAKGRKTPRRGVLPALRGVLAGPPAGLYRQPVLHINCSGLVEIEGCRAILLYDEQQLRLDLGRWQVSLFGDGLMLESFSKTGLIIRGRVFKTEFTYT